MTKPLVKIHNAATGEIIEREMNTDEFAKFELEEADRNTFKTQAEAKANARAQILDRLGLTDEEAKILLG